MDIDIIKSVWPEWEIDIEKPLGKGSYGTVYKAVRRDHNVESYAAIKVISIPNEISEVESLRSEGLGIDSTRTYFQGIVNDFISEIQLMESLKGIQNIVSVEDYNVIEKENEFGWYIFIRMELLTPFNTYMCEKKNKEENIIKLEEKEVIKLGIDICTALKICNKRNIIHRDIKPENIFINDFGDFKIGDFGIARKLENLTGGLSQKGTMNYMAPEVATSADYDARVDIYSLGIVLYKLLNENRFPFLDNEEQMLNPNARRTALERRIRGEKLTPPSEASPEMADIILRACSFNPDYRFSSALEMKDALESVRDGYYRIVESDLDKTEMASPLGDNACINQEYTNTSSVESMDSTGDKVSGQDNAGRKNTKKKKGEKNKLEKNKGEKKKGKPLKVIMAFLIIAVLAGGGVYFAPEFINNYLKNNNSEDGDNTASGAEGKGTDADTEDGKNEDRDGLTALVNDGVASIIAEADKLAESGDYEGALAKIQTALITYPESEDLRSKTTEYTAAIDGVKKETVLAEASAYVDAENYTAALELLEEMLNTYGEDADYRTAYDTYNKSYMELVRSTAVTDADSFVESGDYLKAARALEDALAIIGTDAEMEGKRQSYENIYVSNTIAEVEEYMEAQDFDEAEKVLDKAIKELPEKQKFKDEKDVLEKKKPKYLVKVCSPYEWSKYNYNESEQIIMSNEVYTNGFILGGDAVGEPFALYNLGGKYERMNFTLGHVDGSTLNDGIFHIYLDEELVERIEVNCETLPKEYTISLNGASQMKILQIDYHMWSMYGFANVALY